MKVFRTIALGMRLALAGGRASVIRLCLMSLGMGLGVALLLAAITVSPAVHARDLRESTRAGASTSDSKRVDATLQWWLPTTFEGRDVLVIGLAADGKAAPVPPGIPRLPGRGETFVSPELAQVLAGPDGYLLRPRVPGHVAGEIKPIGLVNPRELVAYVSPDAVPPALRSGANRVTSFDPSEITTTPFTAITLVAIALVIVALLVPIALFIVTVTRLSSATRETRLAAVRLAGATQAQIRALAAVESGLAATIGCVVGLAVFLSIRPLVASYPPLGGFFPSDITPPTSAALFLLFGVPAFAVAVSNTTMKRVVVTPLGIARRVRSVRRGWQWPAMLVAGLLILVICASHHKGLMRQPVPIPGVIVGFGLLLELLGLAGVVPWLSGWGGRMLALLRPPPSVLIGARRLESDPAATGRVIAGITVLIAVVVVIQSIFLTGAGVGNPPAIDALSPSDVVVQVTGKGAGPALRSLVALPGVVSLSADVSRTSLYGATYSTPCCTVLHTNGDPATLERVRNALLGLPYAEVFSAVQLREVGSAKGDQVVKLLQLAIFVLLMVSAASLLVSTVDGMMERRRPFAVLSAIGVANSVLRRSIIFQVSLPLVLGVLLGVGVGTTTSILVFKMDGQTAVIPFAQISLTTGFVGAMTLLVTGASLAWLRITRRPELLRND